MSDTSTQVTGDEDIQAILAQLAATSGQATNPLMPTPIGVPKYQVGPNGNVVTDSAGNPVPWSATVQGTSAGGAVGAPTTQVPTKYWSGEQWSLIQGMADEDVYAVQRQLIDAGLLKSKGVVAGNWTTKEASAFWNVLAVANNSGVTWADALSQMAANGRANPPETKLEQRPQIEVSKANPYAVAATADGVAQRLLGRKFSDAERQQFLDSWSSTEDKSNAAMVATKTAEMNATQPEGGDLTSVSSGVVDPNMDLATASGLGGPVATQAQQVRPDVRTVNQALTPEQAAQQWIEQNRAGEAGATAIAGQVQNLLQIMGSSFGGGVSGRPGA